MEQMNEWAKWKIAGIYEMQENRLTRNEAIEAADILRDMLDDEQRKTELLKQRNKELELLLMKNDIAIPDYELWHDALKMV
ncbi:hypothetical protein ABFV83_09080 [Lacrimispora sp. BS-2]|uniref:Uncharacterized protein n=1 Tax=Lacrimispora sp. BS-2 TaxID=3151850 RepID=A0AAU7PK92_9FIRM